MKLNIRFKKATPSNCSGRTWLEVSSKFKIAKVTLLLLFAVSFTAFANNAQVDISLKNASLKEVMTRLAKQTEFAFMYSDADVKDAKLISVNLKNATLEKALREIFADQPLAYSIKGNSVIVTRKPQEVVFDMDALYNAPITVTGRIVDEQGRELVGASIRVKGTRVATTSNNNGEFTLTGVDENATLEVSFLGYETLEVRVRPNVGTIVLQAATGELDKVDVVNTGYQTLSKERVTGSYATISAEKLEDKLQPNLVTMLEGQLAGLTVDQNNQVVIRGISTLNASRKPLVVIDGYPVEPSVTDNFYRYDDGLFKDINADNIESVTVLKDAVAASIYGARAANGVIIITTKKGREGAAKFSYRGVTGLAPTPSFSNLNKASTNDYIDAEIDLLHLNPNAFNINTGTGVITRVPYLLKQVAQGEITQAEADAEINQLRNNDYLADVREHMYRTGFSHQHNLNVSGGTERHTYNAALNYMEVKQNFKGANSDRFTVDLKEDWKFNRIVSAGLAANLSYATFESPTINPDRELTTGDATGSQSLFNFFTGSYFTPYTRLVDDNGNAANLWGMARRKVETYSQYSGMKPVHYDFLNDYLLSTASTQNLQARLSGYLRLNILPGLNGEIGGNWQRGSYKYFNIRDKESFGVREAYNDSKSLARPASHYLPDGSIVNENRNTNDNWTIRGQINFSKDLDNSKHLINAIAGTEIRRSGIDRVTLATRAGYNRQAGAYAPVNILDYNSSVYANDMLFGRRISLGTGSYGISDNRFTSWYGNGSYEYDNRYIVSGSIRLDLTNFFGTDPKYRYRPLWSVGGTWKLSNEAFFNNEAFSRFHIRGSYGVNGNISLNHGPYLILSNASYNNTAQGMGSSISSPPNDQLRWEKTATTNLGIDFAIFNNWADFSIDWYKKASSDVLASEAVDQTIGFTSVMQNVGKIENTGIELTANSKIIDRGDFRWSASSSFSYNKNEVTEYNVTMAAVGNYLRSTGVNVAGYPVNGIWGLRFAPLNSVGAAMVYNAAGEPVLSSQAQAEDAYFVGSSTPLFDISLNNRFSYKNVELSFMIIAKLGHYYYRDAFHSRNIQNKHVGERWKKPGDEAFAKVPALTTTNSDWWYSPFIDININKADFARLRDITLSYSLDRNWVRGIGLGNAKLYVQGRNLITVRAKGMDIDPETMVSYNGGTNGNVDYSFSSLPLPREIYMGIQLAF